MTEVKETPLATPQPEKIEQITKEPEKQAEKAENIKDPKKVRAGKALAKKNKEAGEAKAAAEKKQEESSHDSQTSKWLDLSSVPVSFFGTDGPSQNPSWKRLFPAKRVEREEEKEPTPPPSPERPPTPEQGILME